MPGPVIFSRTPVESAHTSIYTQRCWSLISPGTCGNVKLMGKRCLHAVPHKTQCSSCVLHSPHMYADLISMCTTHSHIHKQDYRGLPSPTSSDVPLSLFLILNYRCNALYLWSFCRPRTLTLPPVLLVTSPSRAGP